MIAVGMYAGRLIEGRLASPLSLDEVKKCIELIRLNVLATPGRVVLAGDVRGITALEPEWAAMFTAMFTRDNPKVERSGFLVESITNPFGRQLDTMVKTACNPSRRVFDSVLSCRQFLEPVLSLDEKSRIALFFASPA